MKLTFAGYFPGGLGKQGTGRVGSSLDVPGAQLASLGKHMMEIKGQPPAHFCWLCCRWTRMFLECHRPP